MRNTNMITTETSRHIAVISYLTAGFTIGIIAFCIYTGYFKSPAKQEITEEQKRAREFLELARRAV